MEQAFITDKTYDNIEFDKTPLGKGEYEDCNFFNCDFSNTDLAELTFIACRFVGCNLSLATLTKTSFQDAKFKECKMLGLHFENCNQFGLSFSFENCSLNHSSFYKTKIRKTVFEIASYRKQILQKQTSQPAYLINAIS